MFTLERIRAKHFTKAWGFVQGAESLPVLLGVPITGYINQVHPKAGYYFSCVSTILGAMLFFFIGHSKKHEHVNQIQTTECVCPLVAPSPYPCVRDLNPYGLYRTGSHHYERVFANYNESPACLERGGPHRHSYRAPRERSPYHHRLPKSISYAANMDYSGWGPPVRCISRDADCLKYAPMCHRTRPILRPSKSVPEGLARWEHWGSCRRPNIRNVQVIEQITTSV